MSISFKIKELLQDSKNCKHWFSYCSKIILNDYTKEICAKQVANQSDFLKAFLYLEPLLTLNLRFLGNSKHHALCRDIIPLYLVFICFIQLSPLLMVECCSSADFIGLMSPFYLFLFQNRYKTGTLILIVSITSTVL